MTIRNVQSASNKSRSQSHYKAFTLIELLVVIAIIVILASILFPVFARARENARRSSCQSNLKQMGLGIMQYVQDFDESYPPSRNCGGATGACDTTGWTGTAQTNRGMWKVYTYPYVKSTQIYSCPSTGSNSAYEATYPLPGGGTGTFSEQYAYGANVYIIKSVTDNLTPFKASQVGSSSLLAMIGDATWTFCDNPSRLVNSTKITPVNHSTYSPDPQYGRHFEGSNILYVDGHVKYQSQAKMGPAVGVNGYVSGAPNDHQYGLPWDPADPRVR